VLRRPDSRELTAGSVYRASRQFYETGGVPAPALLNFAPQTMQTPAHRAVRLRRPPARKASSNVVGTELWDLFAVTKCGNVGRGRGSDEGTA